MSEYQRRTPERLIEILRARDQNPRSIEQEAADAIGQWMANSRENKLIAESCERDRKEAVAALAARLPDREGWQSIETAPKDGRFLLAVQAGPRDDGEPYVPDTIRWFNGQWDNGMSECIYFVPTHWMPLLPSPPADHEQQCQCGACVRDGQHASSCAVHNGPALPIAPCNCRDAEDDRRKWGFHHEQTRD